MNGDNPREARALKVGEFVPAVVLQDTDGQSVDLYERLRRSALLVVFYRGEW